MTDARSSRTSARRTAAKREILDAAWTLMARDGVAEVNVREVARAVGLRQQSLTYYFPTKLALYRRVLEDLFEDWYRAADTFECSDDPVEAIGGYVRAKMELSRRRPLGSKVWASEIIHGAEHMDDILTQRVKPWLDSRVKVIDDWIARGLLAPVNAQTLMYMIWATTQHYADFDAQIRALRGKRALTQKAFEATTEEVVQLVIRACGAVSPGQAGGSR